MTEVLIIPALFLSICFLGLAFISHYKQRRGKGIYVTISILCLIGAIGLFVFPDWNLSKIDKNVTTPGPKTEENEKPSGNEQKPVLENPPSNVTPPLEEPSNEPTLPEKPLNPATPPPAAPEKVIIPDNETVTYKVSKGDTLWSIASRAGVTVSEIKQWNNLTSDIIYIDQSLKLYGKNVRPSQPAPPPLQEKPAEIAPSLLISSGSTQKKEIALTFDAGSDIAGIQILDVLKKHNVKATFFLTGKWVEKFPEYARKITNDGHEIGNHSYTHPDAVKITNRVMIQDISKAEQAIKTVTGKSPRPYFRFPYGSYNAAALKAVGEAGYPLSIQWSLDTIDWQQPTTEVIISRIETGASNGDIILMHIGGINTPEAVDKVIPWLEEKGYRLVPLSVLLNN